MKSFNRTAGMEMMMCMRSMCMTFHAYGPSCSGS